MLCEIQSRIRDIFQDRGYEQIVLCEVGLNKINTTAVEQEENKQEKPDLWNQVQDLIKTNFQEKEDSPVPPLEPFLLMSAFVPRTKQVMWVLLHSIPDIHKSSISIDHIRHYLQFAEDYKVHHLFLVSSKPLTTTGRLKLNTFHQTIPGFEWEFWLIRDLLIQNENHVLTPRHILLTEEQTQDILTRRKMKREDLMLIETTDAMARRLGARVNQVVAQVSAHSTDLRRVVLPSDKKS